MSDTLRPWFRRLAIAAVVPFVLTACEDDEPTDISDVDPVSQAEVLDNLASQFFTENEAVQSLNFFSAGIVGTGVGSVAGYLPDSPDAAGFAQLVDVTRELVKARKDGSGQLMGNIPTALIGTVWEWVPGTEPGTGSYQQVVDPPNPPANGVRFLLYAVDPITGLPVEPLNQIGHLDILDTSQLPTLNIQLVAVIQGDTLIDISTSATGSETSFDMTADGFVSDGTETLTIDFDLSATGDETSATIDGSLVLSTSQITITVGLGLDADFSGEQESGTLNLTLDISDGENTISFSADLDLATGDASGQVRFNGQVVANITTTTVDSTTTIEITDASGGQLSEEDLAALEQMFFVFEEVFEGAFGVVGLIFLLLGFAFI